VTKLFCLGVGLSAVVFANLACAQAAVPSTRLRSAAVPRVTTPPPNAAMTATHRTSGATPNSRSISAPSLSNASSNLKSSSDMNMLSLQNSVSKRSEQEEQITNIMNSMGNSQKTIAQNIGSGGGGGTPPSGSKAPAAVKAATVPYSASSRKVTSGTVLCRQCRAPATRAVATAAPRQ
jgi:hypothetical protein